MYDYRLKDITISTLTLIFPSLHIGYMNLLLLLFGLPGYATIQNHIFTRICRATLGHRKDYILSLNPFLRGQALQTVKMILGERSYSCFEGSSAGITPLHALWLAVSDNTTMMGFISTLGIELEDFVVVCM